MEDSDSRARFIEFFHRHGDRAYNFAFRLAGNEDDAKDLAQAAFVRAFEHRDRYDDSRPFESWLFRIMQNIYVDAVRRYAYRHSDTLEAAEYLPSGETALDESLVRAESADFAKRALSRLPIHYRTAVTLSDIERLPYETIARLMSCPVGTVRSRVHQGRAMMRDEFERLQKGGVHERS